MTDRYGYIGIETLLNFCSNQKDHCVTPDDFMRMNRVKIDERPQGEWIPCKDDNFCKCSECKQIVMSEERSNFCPNCGASMRKEGEAE